MSVYSRNPSLFPSLAVVLATAGVVLLNVTDVTWLVGGRSVAEVSDAHPTLVTPAGYAFSIWGLIFLGLISFAVYQMLPAVRERAPLRVIRKPYLLSCAAVAAWVVLWRNDWVGTAFFALAALVASLALVYIRLDYRVVTSPAERWLVRAPLTMYLAWTTVACVVNTAVALSVLGLGGAPQFWAVVVVGLLSGIGTAIVSRQGDITFAATLAWAFVGIAVSGNNSGFQPGAPLVATVASLSAAVILLAVWLGRYSGKAEDRVGRRSPDSVTRTNA